MSVCWSLYRRCPMHTAVRPYHNYIFQSHSCKKKKKNPGSKFCFTQIIMASQYNYFEQRIYHCRIKEKYDLCNKKSGKLNLLDCLKISFCLIINFVLKYDFLGIGWLFCPRGQKFIICGIIKKIVIIK